MKPVIFLALVSTLLLIAALSYWLYESRLKELDGTAVAVGYEIKMKPEYSPAFRRTYTKRLDSRSVIEVEYRTSYGRRSDGTLTQPNGARIYFSPDNVADKIIDPSLVPLVEAACEEIAMLDAAFIKADPSEFTDESGVTWTRKKQLINAP